MVKKRIQELVTEYYLWLAVFLSLVAWFISSFTQSPIYLAFTDALKEKHYASKNI